MIHEWIMHRFFSHLYAHSANMHLFTLEIIQQIPFQRIIDAPAVAIPGHNGIIYVLSKIKSLMSHRIERFLIGSSITMWMVILGGCAASVGGTMRNITTVFPIANCYGFVFYGLFFKVIGNICGR